MDRSTRRDFLTRSALLAAGVSAFPLLRPASSLAQSAASDDNTAAGDVAAEDLVDAGETFRRGSARGVEFGSSSNGPLLKAARDGGLFTSRVLRTSTRAATGAGRERGARS